MRYGTGMVIVLTAGLLWSFQALIIRQIEVAGPWAVLAWRSLVMVPVLLAFLSWRSSGSPWPALRKAGLAGVLGGIGLVAAMGGTILAFQTTTIANAAFLLAASPFLAAILGRLILGESVDRLIGGKGSDVLRGDGGDDTLVGGNGSDQLVFDLSGGTDVVEDFANGTDRLDLRAFGFTAFSNVSTLAHNHSGDLVIDLRGDGGGVVTIEGFTLASFNGADVIL